MATPSDQIPTDKVTTPQPTGGNLPSALGTDMNKLPISGNVSKMSLPQLQAERQRLTAEKTPAEVGVEEAKLKAQQTGLEAGQKVQEKTRQEVQDLEKKVSWEDPAFHPTQENVASIGELFSLVATAGMMLGSSGKMSGLNAMNAMSGMLKGWQEGRKDLYNKEKDQFNIELQRLKSLRESIKYQIEKALTLGATDKADSMQAAQIAASLAGPDSVIAKTIQSGRIKDALDIVDKAIKPLENIRLKQIEAQMKASKGGGGGAGAIQFRYNGAVATAADKLGIHLDNLTSAPLGSEPPGFGEIITDPKKITTGAIQYLGAAITDADSRALQQELSAIIPEIANVEAAGRPGGATNARISELHKTAPVAGDSKINYYMFLALSKQELAIAKTTLQVSGGTPEQIAAADRAIAKINEKVPFSVQDINRILRGPGGAPLVNEKISKMISEANSLEDFDKSVQSMLNHQGTPKTTQSGTTVSNWGD